MQQRHIIGKKLPPLAELEKESIRKKENNNAVLQTKENARRNKVHLTV